jgi:hypothetical protein
MMPYILSLYLVCYGTDILALYAYPGIILQEQAVSHEGDRKSATASEASPIAF